jgi:hypothetical protein
MNAWGALLHLAIKIHHIEKITHVENNIPSNNNYTLWKHYL